MTQTSQRIGIGNSIFGIMLLLNLTIFPGFRAAGASEEPIQPVAQTSQQIANAIDTVEAGVSPLDAFGASSVPYRHWISTQRDIYENLFGETFDIADAVYIMDSETTAGHEHATSTGSTILGYEYSVHFSLIVEYDYQNDSSLPADAVAELAAVEFSLFVFTGTIFTALGSEHVTGFIFQATRPDGGRNRGMIPLVLVDEEMIDTLEEAYLLSVHPPSPPTPGGTDTAREDCETEFALAEIAYGTAVQIAASNLQGCLNGASGLFLGGFGVGVICGIVGGFAGLAASPAGPGAVMAALYAFGTCAALASGAAIAAVAACRGEFAAAVRNAAITRQGAREAARLIFGEENCPDDPA